MRALRYVVTRAGLALAVVALLAGASIAYALTWSTTVYHGGAFQLRGDRSHLRVDRIRQR